MARTNNPDVTDKIEKAIKLIKSGAFTNHALAAVGLARDTFYTRMAKDATLRERVLEAAEAACAGYEVIIRNAAQNDWRAAAWYLERRKPQLYARHMKIDVSQMSTEQLEELVSAIDARVEVEGL